MSVIDRFVAAVTPPESEEDRARAREKARAAAGAGDWLDQILQHHQQIEMAFSEAEAAMDASSRTRAQRKRSEEHTSELQSLMRISYAVFCLKKKKKKKKQH